MDVPVGAFDPFQRRPVVPIVRLSGRPAGSVEIPSTRSTVPTCVAHEPITSLR